MSDIVRNPKTPEERFIEFAEKQIEDMRKYSQIGSDIENLKMYELNNALASYQRINATLLNLYNISKIELKRQETLFEEWYAEKYIICKNEEKENSDKGKFPAAKEIEILVRSKYKVDYKKHKELLFALEAKESFLRRLCDAWASQQYILVQLSKNLIAEMENFSKGGSLTP